MGDRLGKMGDKWGYSEDWTRDTFNKTYFRFDYVMMTSSVSVRTGNTYNSTTVMDNPITWVLVFISAKNANDS